MTVLVAVLDRTCQNWIGTTGALFLDLGCQPQIFYARAGYQELYDCVASRWDEHATKRLFRVILQGNAGTGKSWFQVYALKKLLSEGGQRKFDIVICQVDSTIYAIDLAEATVYTWAVPTEHIKQISKTMKRALYFFEPGGNPERKPLEVVIPSLSKLLGAAANLQRNFKN